MNKKSVLILGICTYSFLLLGAVFFYKERTAFLDIAYHLFCILKDQHFAIQNSRFGAMATQVFPLLASKLGCSLNTIAILYSASFIILYASTFFTILLIQKNSRIALAYLIFCIIITAHTFYWAQSELPQAAAFLFLYLGYLDNTLSKGFKPAYWFWASILLLLVCFTHPLMIFAVTFSMAFLAITYREKWKTIAISFAIYFVFVLFKAVFFRTNYDTQALGGLKNIITFFPNLINLTSNKNLLQYLINDYYLLLIGFIAVNFFYIKNKMYLKFVLVNCFCFGYTFIVNITYPHGSDQFYLENQYLLLGLFVALPLTVDILPSIRMKPLGLALVACGLTISLIRIYETHKMYTVRLNWNRALLKSTKNLPRKKLIVRTDNMPDDILLKTWGSCYEFWLLSTMEENETRSIIIERPDFEFGWAIKEDKKFITPWGIFAYAEFHNQYFKFHDSTAYEYYVLPK